MASSSNSEIKPASIQSTGEDDPNTIQNQIGKLAKIVYWERKAKSYQEKLQKLGPTDPNYKKYWLKLYGMKKAFETLDKTMNPINSLVGTEEKKRCNEIEKNITYQPSDFQTIGDVVEEHHKVSKSYRNDLNNKQQYLVQLIELTRILKFKQKQEGFRPITQADYQQNIHSE